VLDAWQLVPKADAFQTSLIRPVADGASSCHLLALQDCTAEIAHAGRQGER